MPVIDTLEAVEYMRIQEPGCGDTILDFQKTGLVDMSRHIRPVEIGTPFLPGSA